MIDIQKFRTWIMLYLISFVALLWAVFLIEEGASSMFLVSMLLIMIVVGVNFIIIIHEIREKRRQKEMMKSLSRIS
ncbi:MAG: hypothetical protein QHG99_04515 [Methanomicrobiales archaeon]|nr:hypothetical protein [Methanomicrobiales archaeon]